MKKLLSLACLLLLAIPALATEHLRLATTTSTENSGLLAELLPPFEQANDCKVDVIAMPGKSQCRLVCVTVHVHRQFSSGTGCKGNCKINKKRKDEASGGTGSHL